MITSTASWRRCERLTAALRKAATESVADTMRTLSSPEERAGKDTPTTSPMIARTTTISTRVTPRRFLSVLPADDIGIDSFAAGLTVRTQGHDVRLVITVLSGETICLVHTPGIFSDVARHVRAVPLGELRRLDAKRLKTALLDCREGAGVQCICPQRSHEVGDLRARLRDLGLIGLLPQSGSHQGNKQADDRYDHQHFNERHTGLRPFSIPFSRLPHDYTATSLMLVIAISMLKISAPIRMPITRITRGSKIAVKRLIAARVSVS